ncbi:hypothetical protein LSH36_3g19129 [Paralvinella palmiformis]|uniref:Uncharacterized protein n=1 Tax=Paralvinella palmiformis TaxID=53620 RepID=A0AAD9NHE0_9ANNE|nr:hypothetical protein LSH36_3g19129 [Paralvinella palmiformis]
MAFWRATLSSILRKRPTNIGYATGIQFMDVVLRNVIPTPCVHQAAFYGDMRELKLALDSGQFLLDKGFDINHKDTNGRTALHLAATNGHLETIKMLVTKGADVKLSTAKGRTVLGSAMCNVDRDRQRPVIDYLKNCDREKMSWEID